MPGTYPGSRWTAKPPPGTPVNRAHPLAATLRHSSLFNAGFPDDLIDPSSRGTARGTARFAAGPLGMAASFDGTDGSDFSYGSGGLTGRNGDISIFVVARNYSLNGTLGSIAGPSSDSYHWGGASGAGPSFVLSNVVAFAANSINQAVDIPYAYGYSYKRGVGCRIWVRELDGLGKVQTQSFSDPSLPTAVSGQPSTIGSKWGTNSTTFNGLIYETHIFDSALPDADFEALSSDRFAFFAVPNARRFFAMPSNLDTGVGSGTVGRVTGSGSGSSLDSGTAAGTLGQVSGSAAGSALDSGAAAGTLGQVTGTGTGILPTGGTAAGTLGKVTGTSSGTSLDTGTAAGTLGHVTGSASGSSHDTGTASGTLGQVTGTGTGILPTGGTAAGTLGKVTGTSSGTSLDTGTAAGTLGKVTGSATGTGLDIGSAAGALGRVTGTGFGILPTGGTAAGSLGRVTGTAAGSSGTVAPPSFFELDLVGWIKSNLALTCYPGHIPEGASLPAISFLVVGGATDSLLSGPSGLVEVDVQIDVESTDYFDVGRISLALARGLTALVQRRMGSTWVGSCTLGPQISRYDPAVDGSDLGTHGKSLDFTFQTSSR